VILASNVTSRVGSLNLRRRVGMSMQTTTDYQIGLDSQCLSYLIDGLEALTPPAGELETIRVSLARLYFYTPGTLWVTPTVKAECARIRNEMRRALHTSWMGVIFGVRQPLDLRRIEERAGQLRAHHMGEADCRIVAEAESAELRVLVSNDVDLRKHLKSSTTLALLGPEELWNELGIPRGAQPTKLPHSTNPLSSQDWWRW